MLIFSQILQVRHLEVVGQHSHWLPSFTQVGPADNAANAAEEGEKAGR
jgi:hypothetical protein